MSSDSWYPASTTAADAHLTLFCLPHAGGGASTFRSWQDEFGDGIDLAPVMLPGRERRIAEPSMTSITVLADALVEPTLGRAPGGFALFGHSMGALVAFELAHRLTAAGRPPELLIISGSGAAHKFRTAFESSGLSDDEFLDSVDSLGGVPEGVFDIPELREILLPSLRTDYRACETYVCEQRSSLDLPLLVLCGDADPRVGPADLEAWRELSSRTTTVRVFDGGHFYLFDRLPEVVRTIHSALDVAVS